MTNLILALQVVALTHATVIDVNGGSATKGLTIILRDRRIERVGPPASTPIPAGARTIDLAGRFVMPGMWDMHVHNDVPGGRHLLPLYVAWGVTGVRDMNGQLGTLRRLQRDVASGKLRYMRASRRMARGSRPRSPCRCRSLSSCLLCRRGAKRRRITRIRGWP
jgi:hypothetical protein